jgi:gamma-glutamylcyclotransferase (GGCT)/AIG2-like uncharacterized protein YtfP
MRYYFAYGSNLNLAQMKSRCLEAKVIGTTVLNDYQLVFKTHLDVVPKKDSTVPIGIFFISSSDEAALDRYEGVEAKYYEKKEITVEFGNQKITGLIYVMTDQNPNALKG